METFGAVYRASDSRLKGEGFNSQHEVRYVKVTGDIHIPHSLGAPSHNGVLGSPTCNWITNATFVAPLLFNSYQLHWRRPANDNGSSSLNNMICTHNYLFSNPQTTHRRHKRKISKSNFG